MRRIGLEAIEVVAGGIFPPEPPGPRAAPRLRSRRLAEPPAQAPAPEPPAATAEDEGDSGPLPTAYAQWMAELLPAPLPAEPLASCERCAMHAPASGPEPGMTYFSAQTKCCTYVPHLANFLVGRILIDADPAAAVGRATVLQRIAERNGVSPLGLAQPLSYTIRYRYSAQGFGRQAGLLCPHHVDGRCGIWKHREATCATWFCKFADGAPAAAFYDLLRQFLGALELELSSWCAHRLGLASPALADLEQRGPASLLRTRESFSTHLMGSALEDGLGGGKLGRRGASDHAALFGDYAGREAAYYEDCARLLDGMTLEAVAAALGFDLAQRGARLLRAFEAWRTPVRPSSLVAAPHALVQIGGRACVQSYRPSDPRRLSPELLEALRSFDGRPLAAVQAEIGERLGLELDEALIDALIGLELLTYS